MMSELREWMRDPIGNCRTIGLYAGPLGWAVNEGLLKKMGKPLPKTWDDLAKPDYKGLIAVANPNTSGTAYTELVTILLMKGEEKGWDYLAKLHKNTSQYTKSGSAPGQLAGRGEVAIAIVFLHDAIMYADEGFPVKPVAPADGTGYEIGGLSLIKGAPHPAIAKKVIDWALTPDVQAIAKDFRSFQLQSTQKTPLPAVVIKHGMDFEHVKTIKYDFLWASQNRDRILKRWTEQVYSQSR
jgi:iron(III) transport system substrate-binding protein